MIGDTKATGPKLRCEAPFRDSNSEAAFIRIGADGFPFVYDVGEGVAYRLVDDPRAPRKADAAQDSDPDGAGLDGHEGDADDCRKLPWGFIREADGSITRVKKNSKGDDLHIPVVSRIDVLALARDPEGEGWSSVVAVQDPDGNTHRWNLPQSLVAAEPKRVYAGLAALGARLAVEPMGRQALIELLTRWQPTARATAVPHLGWADPEFAAFLLPDGRVLGAQEYVFAGGDDPAKVLPSAGTLAGWQAEVAALCRGNPILICAVALGFAAPLMEPLNVDGGGLHLRGASSRGKTAALRAAASVWGAPSSVRTWRATSNGLECVAARHNGTLLCLDELAEINGREAAAAAYMLSNGQGKARAARDGSARQSTRWRLALLSSGEISLATKIAEGGGEEKAGQAVRLVDVAADTRAHGAFDDLHGHDGGAAFADAIKRGTATHYGHAGPQFVETLIVMGGGALGFMREEMDAFTARLLREGDVDGQVLRVAARFALIATAGELAARWGIVPWRPGEATAAAEDLLANWIKTRGGAGSAEAAEAVRRTRAFLVAHGESRFERLTRGVDDDRPTLNRAGWRGDNCFYFAEDAWNALHAGADPLRAARAVRDAGYLLTEGDRLRRKLPRAAVQRMRCFCVAETILEAGGDHD